MKAFVLAIFAAVVLTIGANLILTNVGFSTANEGTSSSNVRLD